jgi:hypothetical protein
MMLDTALIPSITPMTTMHIPGRWQTILLFVAKIHGAGSTESAKPEAQLDWQCLQGEERHNVVKRIHLEKYCTDACRGMV